MNFVNGLKLWSTNISLIDELTKLYQDGICQYVEIYIKPNTFSSYIEAWQNVNIPFIIHAPHFGDGLNFSVKEKKVDNYKMAYEAIEFAERLDARYIIFHPGVGGDIYETIREINELKDNISKEVANKLVVENKPQLGLNNEKCIGHSIDEIKLIMDRCDISFCLDIGHSICSANSKGIKPLDYIKGFVELKPVMYHLTDGDYYSQFDSHLNFGLGSYPIKDIVKIIKPNSIVTNEAQKSSLKSLDDFVKDIEFLKKIDK